MLRPALAVTLVLLLAGCSDRPDAATQSTGDDVDFGDVQATATTGVIRGIVVDTAIRPLADALVHIGLPTNRSTTTGDDGQFAFQDLDPGTYFLTVSLADHTSVQQSVEVVAGDSAPPIVRVQLERLPSTQPFVDTYQFTGYLTFGAAIGLTSIGTTINPTLAGLVNDKSIWSIEFTQLPAWAQGELVWQQTQPAGGQFIFEIVHGNNNTHRGFRTTGESPALAYWNTSVLERYRETVLENGTAYRFFGGPHPLLAPGGPILPPREQCPPIPGLGFNPCSFGFGLTVQQKAELYIHNFYNFAPPEGWRYTVDGDPVVPAE